jgi:hypothetical protein
MITDFDSLDPVHKKNNPKISGVIFLQIIFYYFLIASAIVFPISAGLATT